VRCEGLDVNTAQRTAWMASHSKPSRRILDDHGFDNPLVPGLFEDEERICRDPTKRCERLASSPGSLSSWTCLCFGCRLERPGRQLRTP
jgi:hypothetical protein